MNNKISAHDQNQKFQEQRAVRKGLSEKATNKRQVALQDGLSYFFYLINF